MENVHNRMDFKLAGCIEECDRLACRPNVANASAYNEDLMGFVMEKTNVTMDCPLFIGQCMLDDSKAEMYQLFYDYLKTVETFNEGAQVKLGGGDTDSLFTIFINVNYPDLVRPMMMASTLLDTSNYPEDHPHFSNKYKAQLGKVKDESESIINLRWTLLKPKLYCMEAANNKAKKKAKGVARASLALSTPEDYTRCWREHEEMLCTVRRIGSYMHNIYTYKQVKRALSIWEDKRAWVDHNTSLLYGHYSLNMPRPTIVEIVPPEMTVEPAARSKEPSVRPKEPAAKRSRINV